MPPRRKPEPPPVAAAPELPPPRPTHPMTVEIVLPNTGVPVRQLLHALAAYLAADARRHMKTYKTGPDHPAVVDKTDAAESVRRLALDLEARSKARWDAHAHPTNPPGGRPCPS